MTDSSQGDQERPEGVEESTARNSKDSFVSRLDHHLQPLVADSTLQPLAIVVGLTIVSFATGGILIALRDRNAFAISSLGLLALVSVDLLQRDLRERRFGFLSRSICLLWFVSGGLAFLVVQRGWF
ncbi:hypothetical protein MK489_09705 [Myxococcota bacterium]|nr:hypothetical protein [Myxococcota bacterium]